MKMFLHLIAFIVIIAVSSNSKAQTIRFVTETGAGTLDGSSWGNAAPGTGLQAMITASASGDEVWVAKGSYLPTTEYGGTGNAYKTFRLKNGVKLYGGFAGSESSIDDRASFGYGEANATTLSGDHSGDDAFPDNMTDNSLSVMNLKSISPALTSATILDGFIVSGGYNSDFGAGINLQSQSMTINNCVVRNNISTYYGGGISLLSSTSTIDNCTIEFNYTTTTDTYEYYGGAGVFITNCTNTILQNSVIRNNTSGNNGGGVFNDGGRISGCSVYSNVAQNNGGGIFSINTINLEGNTIYENVSDNGAGMYLKASGSVTNNTFHNNSASNSGGGLFVYNFYQNSAIVNNTIANNRCDSEDAGGTQAGGGLYVVSSSGNTKIAKFKNNNIANNYKGSGAVSDDSKLDTYGLLESNGNNIVETSAGYTWNATGDITGDQASLNLATTLSGDEPQVLALSIGSVAIDAGAWGTVETTDVPRTDQQGLFRNVTVDIGSYEYNGILRDIKPTNNILYVTPDGAGLKDGSSWENAIDGASYENNISYLQYAISNSSSGDQIWVAAGTYKPTDGTDRTISFILKDGVSLYGGFAGNETVFVQRDIVVNQTILSGDIGVEETHTDDSYHVVYCNTAITASTILDGFSIQYGNANGTTPNDQGGGIHLASGVDLTISNCIIKNNNGKTGAGLYIASSASIEHCEIFDNTSTSSCGGAYITSSSGVFKYNSVYSNTARTGAGLYIVSCTSGFQLLNSTIHDNTATTSGAGIYLSASNVEITNSTIAYNYSNGVGGGIQITNCSPILTNNTIVYNHSDNDIEVGVSLGGGIEVNNAASNPLFKNNLIAENYSGSGTSNPNDFRLTAGSVTDNGYNIVENSSSYTWSGTGDLTGEQSSLNIATVLDGSSPQTIAILTGSVAIDAGGSGTNGSVSIPTTDQRNLTRSTVDIGAYEYNSDPVVNPTDGILYISTTGNGLKDGSSWENAFNGGDFRDDGVSFLNRAITLAPNNTKFWVKAGTYKTTNSSDRTKSFSIAYSDTLYGGFAGTETSINQRANYGYGEVNATILSGDIDGVDDVYTDFPNNVGTTMDGNAYHVLQPLSSSLVDGCVIIGGNANGTNPNCYGGGVYAPNATLSNCTIRYNKATDGGGVYLSSALTLKFNSCITEYNYASNRGGGIYLYSANSATTIDRTTVRYNSSVNEGGGLYLSNASITIKNSTFEHDSASYGGGIYTGNCTTSSVLTNNTLVANSSSYNGSAINVANASLILTNNTLAYNTADSDDSGSGGGAIIFSYSTTSYNAYLKNNLIAQNFRGIASPVASDYSKSGSGTVTSNGGNIIESGSSFGSGTGDYTGTQANLNIDSDLSGDNPQVIELLAGSIAINSGLGGTNSTESVPTEDQTGKTRGLCPDIGAFEFETVSPTVRATSINISPKGSVSATINWTNGNGSKRIVGVKQATTGTAVPVNGTTYAADTIFGSGDPISDNFYTVYNGSGSSVTITGLTENTTYRVQVIEYNGCEGEELYLTGSVAGNPYSFTTKRSQTITFGELVEKTYGDASFSLSATTSSGLTVTFSSSDNTVATVSETTVTIVGAGTCSIYASQAGNSTYDAAPQVERVLAVNAKELTVSGAIAQNKIYDGNTDATITGATLVGKVGEDDVYIENATGTFGQSSVGTGVNVTATLTIVGTKADNYTLTQPTGLGANITPKELTIGGSFIALNKVYNKSVDAAINTNSLTLVGIVGDDEVSLTNLAAEFEDYLVSDGKTVSIVSGSLSGANKDNYTLSLTGAPTTNADITEATLTVTGAVAAYKVYDGNTDATISGATLNGVYSDDNVVLTNYATGTFSQATAGDRIGITTSMAITGTDIGNYLLEQPVLSADITTRELTVTGSVAQNKTYDGTNTATISGATLSGKVDDDEVLLGDQTAGTFAQSVVGNAIEVNTNMTISGADADNYYLTQPDGLSANITPKTLTIDGSFTVLDKVYNRDVAATINTNSLNLNGVIGVEDVSLSGITVEFEDYAVSDGKTVVISNAILLGADKDNYTLSLVGAPEALANITVATLTVTGATAQNKVYDGNTNATVTGATLSGVYTGDAVSLNNQSSGAFSQATIGEGISVSTSMAIMGTSAFNYTIEQPALSADITQKGLTVVNAVAQSKVYDGTTSATITGASLSGVIGSDIVNLNNATAGTFAQSTFGDGIAVSTSMGIAGDDAGNYSLIQPNLAANIEAKELIVTGTVASSKVYDGNTIATITGATLSGVVDDDEINLVNDEAGTFAQAAVEIEIAITTSMSIEGTDAENYYLTQPSGLKANITPRALTVTGATASNKVYDGNVNASISYAQLDDVVNGDAVTLDNSTVGTFSQSAVGNNITITTAMTLDGEDAGNYSLTQPAGLMANITPKSLTVSGANAQNKVYDGTTAATVSGATLEGVIAPDQVSLTNATTGTFAQEVVENNISVTTSMGLSSDDAGNYTLSQPSGLSADITAKGLTVINASVQSKVYDKNTNATITGAELDGVVAGDVVFLDNHTTGIFAQSGVGNGISVSTTMSISGADYANYTLAQPTLSGDITPRPLTITANSFIKTLGLNYTFQGNEFTVNNLVSTDAVTTVVLTSTGAASEAAVGTYPIIPGNASGSGLDNYSINYVNGVLTVVDQKELTLTGLTASSKPYDGTSTATITNWGTLQGIEEGDEVTLNHASALATYENKSVGDAKTVTITGLTLSGVDANKYYINSHTTTANIIARSLTLSSFTADSKVYDGNATVTGTGFADDRVTGDNLTFGYAAAFEDKNVGDSKAVNYTSISITGGSDAANYYLAENTGSTTAAITKKGVNVINAVAESKVYDGNDTASIIDALLMGSIEGDDVSLANSTTGLFVQSVIGENISVTPSMTLIGGDAGNYSLTQPTLSANITVKELTVTGAIAQSKVYDGTNAAAIVSASLEGAIESDQVSLVNSTNGTFAQVNVGTGILVTTAMGIEGDDVGNYILIQPTLSADITKRNLVVSGTSTQDKIYDGTNTALIENALLEGVIEPDQVNLTNANTGTFAQTNVGNGIPVTTAMGIEGDDVGNYTLIQPDGLSANITPKSLTVVNSIAQSKIYDGTTTALITGAELNGIVGDDVVALSGNSSGVFTQKDVGSNIAIVTSMVLAGADNANYALIQPTLTANITPKPLTITANSMLKTFGTTYTYDGSEFSITEMVSGDEVTTVTLTCTGTASDANVGDYDIIPSNAQGVGLGNYSIEYVKGTMTVVNQTQLSLAGLSVNNKVYDGTNVATILNWGTLQPITEGDVVELDFSNAVIRFVNENVNDNKTVTISGLSLTGVDANKYFINNHTTTANITKRTLVLSSFTADSKIYDGTIDVTGHGFDDDRLVNDDLVLTYNVAFSSKIVGVDKIVNYSNIAISSGTDKSNYLLASTSGVATATITAKQLTIAGSFTVLDKEYDGTTLATIDNNNLSLVGIVDNDIVTLNPVAAFSDSNVGENIAVNLTSSSSIAGADSENYTLSLIGAPSTSSSITQTTATQYTLTLSVVGNGSVEVNDVAYTEPITVDEGTVLNLEAIAANGHQFDGWSGDLVSTSTTGSITMDGDRTITATFSAIPPTQYTLAINVTGNGSVDVNDVTYTSPITVDEGTVLNLEALAADGYQFDGWSGDLVSASTTGSVTMDGNKTITATFSEIPATQYTLAINVTGNGSVEVNDVTYTAPITVDEGTVLNLEALAADGYQFDGWSGDLISGSATGIVTMDGNKTITATFSEIPPQTYTVTFTVTNGTAGVVGASININSQTLTTDSNGIVLIELEDGSYNYSLLATGYHDVTGTITVNGADVSEAVSLTPTGINDNLTGTLSVYPNPFTGQFTIDVNEGVTGYYTITSIIGTVMLKGTLTGNRTIINLERFKNGFYLLQTNINEKQYTTRIVKQ